MLWPRLPTRGGGTLAGTNSWVAYSVFYAGDGSEVVLSLSYSPVDFLTDEAMTLDLYGPINPPPSGEKIAAADQGDNWGQKQLALVSTVAGTYTLIITNWDPNGRPVQFSMTASGPSGRSGPAFTFLSSGS